MQRACVVAVGLIVVAAPGTAEPRPTPHPVAAPAPASAPAPLCSGDYADEITALKASVREYERDPAHQFSYCLRTTAVYECLSYASDGTVRRTRKATVAHGTGFAYRRAGGDTYVVTNDHVATWPSVTDDEHELDDVPAGCKLVADSVKIVDDEDDDYEPNDIVLSRVVDDPTLDVAVLKTRVPLRVLPYRIGRSAGIHLGNAVAVRGFPLGAFAATNIGKVVNAYDHDTDKDWDHVDFVVDALLSPGNSGSPVLAVSCRTGEYELVGIYHAGYVRGSALNVVVGIDQVRDLMVTLRRAPRAVDRSRTPPGPDERKAVQAALGRPGAPAVFPFPFGPLVGVARLLPSGAIAYEVFSRGFPLRDDRLLVVEDLPPTPAGSAFGATGRVYIGNVRGLRELYPGVLDAEAQAQLDRVMTRLRTSVAQTADWRAADESTSAGHRERRSIEGLQQRQAEQDRDAAQALTDLTERLGPRPGDATVAYKDALPTRLPSSSGDTVKATTSASVR